MRKLPGEGCWGLPIWSSQFVSARKVPFTFITLHFLLCFCQPIRLPFAIQPSKEYSESAPCFALPASPHCCLAQAKEDGHCPSAAPPIHSLSPHLLPLPNTSPSMATRSPNLVVIHTSWCCWMWWREKCSCPSAPASSTKREDCSSEWPTGSLRRKGTVLNVSTVLDMVVQVVQYSMRLVIISSKHTRMASPLRKVWSCWWRWRSRRWHSQHSKGNSIEENGKWRVPSSSSLAANSFHSSKCIQKERG